MSDPVLEAHEMRRAFGGLVAVDTDHLALPRHRITSLIGPNGAGKTTLFNVLTGFERADSGTWTLDGRDITGLPAHRIAQLGMVRTFQLTRPIARLTVLQSVMLASHGHPGERLRSALVRPAWIQHEGRVASKSMEILELVGLADKSQERAGDLSGGQRRLLEIARGLVSAPSLLLLDEPMAGVNPALADTLLETIVGIRDAGTTVVLIEHDMDAVARVSDHVICMAQGRVISEGLAAEVMDDPAVIEAYLGSSWGTDASGTGMPSRSTTPATDADTAPLISVDDLVGGYTPSVNILQGCSLSVAPDEIVAVIGPNGAGKSTLLRALFGLVHVVSGTIHVAGEDVTDMAVHERVQLGLGFVPQMNNIFPQMTVRENLQVGAHGRAEEFGATLDWVCEMFPLVAERPNVRGAALSGGQRQILALARALMRRPSILVVDEPSAGLSPLHQSAVFEQLQQIRSAGMAVLVVEQNARACLEIADRGYVLEQGRDVRQGRASELLRDEKVVELYLGTRGSRSAS